MTGPPHPAAARLTAAVRTVPAAAARLAGRTPLRVKLVAALLVLVAVALTVTGLAANTALRRYLIGRVDSQLLLVGSETAARVNRGFVIGRGPVRAEQPSAFFVLVSGPDGQPQQEIPASLRPNQSPPALPRITPALVAARAGQPFTVTDRSGTQSWRALVVPLRGGAGTVTVAQSLADVHSTVGRLAAIDALVGVVVLTVLAGVGFLVVRSSLRPLVEVERTAEEIAAGHLERRVPARDPRTEVGRLSRALNSMLGQIESAFRARETSEAAARASEARMRRFVADASHELRTPLTSIRGFAELYRQGAVDGPDGLARIMRRIEGEATRMGLLVEDLLLLARLDQDRPLSRRPVDLAALAQDAVHDARATAPDRPVRAAALPGAGSPVVLGDEARLRQVLANLMSNALTHTPPGTPVTVATGITTLDGGSWATVAVRDDGPGLSERDAQHVFERFFRADPSRTRDHGGAGLGLSIVAAIVAAHGGTVDLQTAPGRGATFRIRLPLESSPSEEPAGRVRTAGPAAAPGPRPTA